MDAEELRTLGHRIVDLLADRLARVEALRVFVDAEPSDLEGLFDEPLPAKGIEPDEVLREVEEKLLPYCTEVNHPGYFGLITPTPTPMGILGDLLASALNQNIGAWSVGPSGVALERRVVRWLADLVGYDERAGGNLTSGGMMANLLAMKLARDATSGDEAQHRGAGGPVAVYASEERHVSVDKAVDTVGLGRDALRVLPTDEAFRLRLDALEEAIESDRRRGVRPIAIVAIAGTTSTGAVDPLPALRAVADREGLWLHVDAAYGGGMLLSRRWPGLLAGIETADSVTIDPHKWFYAPLDAGALVVRDAERLTRSFGIAPPYLADDEASPGRYQYYLHGLEQSRRLRGLKVWMSFKRYGAEAIGSWIDANVAQARRLHELASASEELESATPPPMSAVCLRYRSARLDPSRLDALHRLVARRIEASGRFWIGTTRLKGRSWFRINPVNFRTRLEHVDELFALLRAECRRAAASETTPPSA